MDGLAFLADVIGSLAWPLVILILGVAFRERLNALLTGVRRIRVGSIEAEIAERAREIEEAADAIEGIDESSSPSRAFYVETEDRIRETARFTPRGAILEAWLLVESAATGLLRDRGVHEFKTHSGPLQILNQLERGNLLTDAQREVFESLRQLRNDAVHLPDASISRQDAFRYIESARKLAYSLENKRSSQP
jgi:hypothetical protein